MLESLRVTIDDLIAADQPRPPHELSAGAGFPAMLAVLRQLPGYLCILSGPERDIKFSNAAFERLIPNRRAGAALGETPLAHWPGLPEQIERTFATAEPGHLRQVAVALPPHGERFVDFAIQPILCGDGHLTAVALHGTDVTERVRAEEALRASNEQAESILGVLGDGFVAFDRDIRVVKMNAAALKYDGRQEHEILGRTHWEAWPTSAGSFLEREYARCLEEQVQISIERRYLGFGKDRWLELRLCPVLDGIVSFYRDVTDRKMSEAALRASEERFRALVEAVPHLVWEAGARRAGRMVQRAVRRIYRHHVG